MKRLFSLALAVTIILLSMTAVTVFADEIKLGTPSNIKIIANDYDETDKYNSFSVELTADKNVFKAAKGRYLLLDWQVRLYGSSSWYEVNQFHIIESSNVNAGLFYIEPGLADTFTTAQPDLYNTLKPSLVRFSTWADEESFYFDRDNYTMEFQFRFRAEKEASEPVIGEWSESVYYGKKTLDKEIPSSFSNKPSIQKISCSAISENQCELKMKADVPTEIARYKSSTVGKIELTAEIDLNNDGAWYEFYRRDIRKEDFTKEISAVIDLTAASKSVGSAALDIPQKASDLKPDLNVRIRCLWYTADKNGKYEKEPSLFSEWGTSSLNKSESSDNTLSNSSGTADKTNSVFGFILPAVIAAAVIAVVVIILLIVKSKKSSGKKLEI